MCMQLGCFRLHQCLGGLTILSLQDHFSAVTSLSLSVDGCTLLTAGRDKVAILWDMRTHKKIITVPVFEAVEGKLAKAG